MSESKAPELKPCPFCGGKARGIFTVDGGPRFIECQSCCATACCDLGGGMTATRMDVTANEDYNAWQGMLWRLRDQHATE